VLVFRAPEGELEWENVRENRLAIEVTSRPTRVYERVYKRPAYLALGIKEVWRVERRKRQVLVSRPDAPADVTDSETVTWRPPGVETDFGSRDR